MNKQQQAYIEGFVKRASEYGFDEDQAIALLQKNAKLDVRDVERHLGQWLHDDDAFADASKGVDEANSNSFALRHPVLSGLPTLGIWPTMAKHKALDDITANLYRKHKGIRDGEQSILEEEHRRKKELMPLELERVKRDAQERMLMHGGLLAGGLLSSHHRHQARNDHRDEE